MSGLGASSAIGLLHLAPALALFALLIARRYPGERGVVRLASRRIRRPRRRGAPGLVVAVRRVGHARPRGGLLLASSLAERGPPLRAPAARPLPAG